MTDISPLITLAAVVLSALAAIGAAVVGWVNRRQIHEIHLTMNSRLDQLVLTTEKLALARGAKDALAEDKIERAAAAALAFDRAAGRRDADRGGLRGD
jgi:hypothetical protein